MSKWLAALALLASLALPLATRAQDVPSEEPARDEPEGPADRSTSFQAVEGPQAEQVPGGTLLIVAYGLVWLFSMGYLIRLGRLQASTAADVERLATRLEKTSA